MPTPEESIEVRAKTVENAIREGLHRLGLTREQVEVEILSEGSRGILGFGAEDARVRLTPRQPAVSTPPARPPRPEPPVEPKPAPPPRQAPVEAPREIKPARSEARPPAPTEAPARSETRPPAPTEAPAAPERPARPARTPAPAVEKSAAAKASDDDQAPLDAAVEILSNMLNLMGIDASVKAHVAAPDPGSRSDEPTLILDIVGNDLGILIGRRGETLSALQYLTRLMVNHRLHRWVNVVVDVEEYKNRRERTLQQLALRAAERVIATGRTLALEPMPARERRIIHMALRSHPDVHTESVGEGESRKVTIMLNSPR